MTDLINLAFPELCALEQQIKIEITRREGAEIVRAREQILAIAQSVGIPLKDLIVAGEKSQNKPVGLPKSSGAKVAVRFRHPANAALAWTGRGIKPRWVMAWLADGGTMDQLRVAASFSPS